MAADKLDFRTPTARLIGGSATNPQQMTDQKGKPRLHEEGPDAGKPMMQYSFGIAIPKTPGATHWSQEQGWGAQLWQFGHSVWPNGEAQRPDFAWKITDGDSTIPNRNGNKPCDREGYRGHWIIWLSGMIAPKLYTLVGQKEPVLMANPSELRNGYYVQAFITARSNAPSQSAGLYMNHSMVCLIAYGAEIVSGPDVSEAGFAQEALPAGASLTPVANVIAPVAAGGAPAPVTPPPVAGAPLAPAPVVPVTPAPAVLAPPVAAAPVAPVRQLTAAANGATYEQLIAAGWTDALLIQHGLMLA